MNVSLRIFALLAAFAVAAPALAEKRVALVIGNSAYKHAPALANPRNDAEGVATALKRLKFEVLAGVDLEKPAMERLLQAFAQAIETADVALVFYAGHGLQVHGRNYLVPIDGKLDRESDLPFQAVSLELVQGLMEQSQRTNIMILDACRDNPLARNLARNMGTRSTAIGRGLGETKAGIGTLIVYATQPGNVALDGEGKHSPFTLALLAHLESKGLEVRQVLTRVRQAVIAATKGKQVPWDSSSLTGDFFFVGAPGATPPAPATVTPPAPPPAGETPRSPAPDQETVFWQSIQHSRNAADYKAYLARWPTGTFAELAKLRIADIEKIADVTPPAPPAPAPSDPPGRISTFEQGRGLTASLHFETQFNIASARACQTQCLANPKCLSWQYATDQYSLWAHRRTCSLWATAGKTLPLKGAVAGVIRATPAAAPAPSPAPMDQQALVRELKRKAQAKERENGFCAQTKWPDQLAWRQALQLGGAHLDNRGHECSRAESTPEFLERGFRLRTITNWWCRRGEQCGVSTTTACYVVSEKRWAFPQNRDLKHCE